MSDKPGPRIARVVAASAVAAVLALTLAGCSAGATSGPTATASDTSTGTPTSTPTPTPTSSDVAFSALTIGDCLTLAAGSDQVQPATATVVSCAQSHSSEVYALPTLNYSAFPGDDTLTASASDACQGAFESYVGVDVYDTDLNFSVFTPAESDWDAGHHVATCVVFYTAGDTVGSVKGIGTGNPQLAG